MTVRRLVELLEQASEILKPFTTKASKGTLVYDGTAYSPTPEDRHFDPYALAWWATFSAIISLLDGSLSLNTKQRCYLHDTLCGGMGSFNDFQVEYSTSPEIVGAANKRLDIIKSEICSLLQ